MSVCASASLFSSRKVSSPSRRPLADNERWAALNKSIFQDILNAILFQTTFSSSSVGGKRHHRSTEVGLRSASPPPPPPPPSVAGSESPSAAIVDCKENVRLQSFGSGLDLEIADGAKSASNRSWIPLRAPIEDEMKEEGEDDDDDDDDGEEEEEEDPVSYDDSWVGKSRSTLKNLTEREIVKVGDRCWGFRPPESRHDRSMSFPESRGATVPCGVPPGLKGSPLGVYYETLLGSVPMMIIGLRSYGTRDENPSVIEPANHLSIQPDSTGPRSVVPKRGPKEKLPALKSGPDVSSVKDPYGPTDVCPRDFDGSSSGPKILNKLDHLRSLPSTKQLQPVPPDNYNDDGQRQPSSPYHHHHHQPLQSQLHHTHNHIHSESTRKPADSKAAAAAAAAEDDEDRTRGSSKAKSSRDHSILTILGLLSADDRDRVDQRKPTESSRSVTSSVGEKKRLLGIGVTVTGASRWMAVDKDIVYDMIDQVLNGESEYFAGTRHDPVGSYASRPTAVTSSSSSSAADRPRPGERKGDAAARRAPPTGTGGASKCQGFALLAPRGDRGLTRKESTGRDLMPRHDRQKRCSRGPIRPSATGQLQLQHRLLAGRPSTDPRPAPPKPDPPTVREKRNPSPDGLEGVSVLRSLLNDDPSDSIGDAGRSSATTASATTPPCPSSCPQEATALKPEVPSPKSGDGRSLDCIDGPERSAVKRSRQSITDGKKRRTMMTFDPADLGSRPLTSGASPDHDQSPSCRSSSLSMKWKSSMLLRMRTEEASESEAVECHSSSSSSSSPDETL